MGAYFLLRWLGILCWFLIICVAAVVVAFLEMGRNHPVGKNGNKLNMLALSQSQKIYVNLSFLVYNELSSIRTCGGLVISTLEVN